MSFKEEPTCVLETMEDVRRVLNDEEFWWIHSLRVSGSGGRWRVKSLWLIDLINELAAKLPPPKDPTPVETAPGILTTTIELCPGVVYNADVKKLARERLGLTALDDKGNATEGDHLSTLIYNAQGYRRHDKLVAAGFVPLTREFLQTLAIGTKLENNTGGRYVVKEVQGVRLAMKHGSRKYMASWGSPVRELKIFKETV